MKKDRIRRETYGYVVQGFYALKDGMESILMRSYRLRMSGERKVDMIRLGDAIGFMGGLAWLARVVILLPLYLLSTLITFGVLWPLRKIRLFLAEVIMLRTILFMKSHHMRFLGSVVAVIATELFGKDMYLRLARERQLSKGRYLVLFDGSGVRFIPKSTDKLPTSHAWVQDGVVRRFSIWFYLGDLPPTVPWISGWLFPN